MLCRSCKSNVVRTEVDLGFQFNGSYFPRSNELDCDGEELTLVRCLNCDLVQLENTLNQTQLFNENYGYSSSLNNSMSAHLADIARRLERILMNTKIEKVMDIGGNDGTLIKEIKAIFQPRELVIVDPTAKKWSQNYPDEVLVVDKLFSFSEVNAVIKSEMDLVTSIAMFYDLPSPMQFLQDLKRVIRPGGFWYSEQSYMYSMIDKLSYDTICHEHIEYYSLTALNHMLERINFRIVDVDFSTSNGGSIAVLCQKEPFNLPKSPIVDKILEWEKASSNKDPFLHEFSKSIKRHKEEASHLIKNIISKGGVITGIGASTKGNTLLQYLEVNSSHIRAIEEINPEKWGRVTPGSRIPILNREEIDEFDSSHKIVFPWHFGASILEKEIEYLKRGGQIILPFPSPKILRYEDIADSNY